MSARWRIALALGVALLAILWFGTLGVRPLYRADEARYAEIAREMAVTGDWLTPRLNGFKYFEKPPLQYWATAVAFKLFGTTEWTARLWAALTGFTGVLAAAFLAYRLKGPRAAFVTAAILASSALYIGLAQFNTLDMGVSLFLALAMFGLVLAQRDDASPVAERGWMLVAWAGAALAVLSKGLIGIVLPAIATFAYIAFERDWRLLKRLHIVSGGAVFLAIAAPWFIAASMANAEFARFFFIHEHFERFLTEVHQRYQPVWFFGGVLAWGLVPWTLTVLVSFRKAWREAPAQRFRPLRFLLVWTVIVFAFFSVSSSKLPSYILPIFPALAVMAGTAYEGTDRRWFVIQAVLVATIAFAAAAVAPWLLAREASPQLPADLLAGYAPWANTAAIALGLGAVIAAGLAWGGRSLAAAGALACGGFLFVQIALAGHGRLGVVYSAYDSVAKIKSRVSGDAPFYSVDMFDHSLPFYLGRTVTLVANPDELAASVRWEPERFVPTMAEFEHRWRDAPRAYAMMSPRDYAALAQAGLPMTVIARDPRRVFVEKP